MNLRNFIAYDRSVIIITNGYFITRNHPNTQGANFQPNTIHSHIPVDCYSNPLVIYHLEIDNFITFPKQICTKLNFSGINSFNRFILIENNNYIFDIIFI